MTRSALLESFKKGCAGRRLLAARRLEQSRRSTSTARGEVTKTHASTMDPEAKLARKARDDEAQLSFSAHALMKSRSGLLVAFRVDEANGRAERELALSTLDEHEIVRGTATVGAEKATTRTTPSRRFARPERQLASHPLPKRAVAHRHARSGNGPRGEVVHPSGAQSNNSCQNERRL